MLVLAFDTATGVTTVAVHDGARVVAESTNADGMRHGEVLAPAIHSALTAAGNTINEVTAIGVGVGPGPFTGLRVGLVTARTLSAALGVPAHGVCTLDVLAAAAPAELDGPFVVATDARRKEVYWARYADRWTRVDGPHVDHPDKVATDDPAVGRGAQLYPAAFPNRYEPHDASAGVLAELVAHESVPLLEPLPLYLRRPDATAPGARKSVLATRDS